MRRYILILALLALVVSCSSYTIAEGRNSISIPEYANLPTTKLIKETIVIDDKKEPAKEEDQVEAINYPTSTEANALFLYLPNEMLDNASFADILENVNEINPDIIILLGSSYNQNLFSPYFDNIYELEGTRIILSDRLQGTNSIELYLDDIYAILAQTEFPVLSSR